MKIDIDHLIEDIGNASVVMLGEASHGTHEYYVKRASISKRLITEKGFSFIAVEGDWPDCYSINRFVKGYRSENIKTILHEFDRWPTWMWANWEIAAFADWLKTFNEKIPLTSKIGFYGLDVYSLWESMEAIVGYLDKEDPDAAKAAREAIRCFEPYGEEGVMYARKAAVVSPPCRDEVVNLLREIRMKAQHYDGDREAALNTEQNALIAVNAEKYYSSMIGFDNESWNIRDRHMMETLDRLMKFHGKDAKGIVWEHNTHIGDARATDMYEAGMVNIGQLAREEYGEENVYLIGFSSYHGSVIAGRNWGTPMEKMEVPAAQKGSVEELLHRDDPRDQLLLFRKAEDARRFMKTIPHRAIGVVYHPEREKPGNYVPSRLPLRYDAMIFIDETRALHPLHLKPDGHLVPETYPFGV